VGALEEALRTQLEGGKSLAEVAAARNVAKSKVVAAVRDEILDNPPPRGDEPTPAEATQLAQRIVNAEPGEHGHRGGPFGGPPGP
jgi:hypothetical protein